MAKTNRCGAATTTCGRCQRHRREHKAGGEAEACSFRAQTCRQSPLPNGRCRYHGGKSLAGSAHPSYKTGRHSKYLPRGLAARYAAGVSNPELLELRSEVALVDVRISQLIEAIGKTGSARLWQDAWRAFGPIKAAVGAGQTPAKDLDELERILVDGRLAAATWEELRESIELRRRLTDSETKRMKDLHQMISVQQAIQMMDLLISVVRTHVTDRALLAALSDQFVRLVGSGSSEPATA